VIHIIYNRKRNKQKTKIKTHTIADVKSSGVMLYCLNVPDTPQTKFAARTHLAGQQILHGHPTLNVEISLKFPSGNSKTNVFYSPKGRTKLYKKSHVSK
jgi:hypothetical protein